VVVRWLNLGAAQVGVMQVLCQSVHDRTAYSEVFVTAWDILSLLSRRLMLIAGAVLGFSARASAASASSRHGGGGGCGGGCGGLQNHRAAVRASAAALAAAGASLALAPFTAFSEELVADTTLVVAGVGCAAAAGLVAHF